jgi:hypothetical protein
MKWVQCNTTGSVPKVISGIKRSHITLTLINEEKCLKRKYVAKIRLEALISLILPYYNTISLKYNILMKRTQNNENFFE